MTDIDKLVQIAHVFNRLKEPVINSAIQELQLPYGSRGLDAGCGFGLQTVLLAESVGEAGHVTGLDISAESLVCAKDLAKKAGFSQRVSYQEGNVNELPFDDDTFDWAWSVDCVGYSPIEPSPLIAELARVVRPGGNVAILAWSSEKLLPGYPWLEAQLNATSAGIAPFVKGKKPELHFHRALGWLREVGLDECKAQTFTGNVHAPMTNEHRSALEALFQMRWPGVMSELAEEDWAEHQRLCLPKSPDFILNLPDYYAFFTYSMFQGRVVV